MQQTGTAPGRAGGPRHDGRPAAALLSWWRDAGVDCVLHARPQAWLGQPAQTASPAAAVAGTIAPAAAPAVLSASSADPSAEDFSAMPSLAALVAHIAATCPGAPFADGNAASGVMLMGEAPSMEDLRTGRPFTGPAGQLLDRMLMAVGLDRSGCYISLVAARRRIAGAPPDEAMAADLPLARAHIRLARPRLLVLLGAKTIQALTGDRRPISTICGSWLGVDAGDGPIPALAMFNPAYLLRQPEMKALAWADLLEFKRRLQS